MRHLLTLLLSLLLSASTAPSAVPAAEPKVSVDQRPVAVVRKTFDPGNPPADLPIIKPGEDAATLNYFGIEVYMHVDVLQTRRHDDGTFTSACRVTSVKVTLTLSVTIWLPEKASAALKGHEEGHRRIAEMRYQDADQVARRLAEPYVGKTLTGKGKTREQAIDAAITDASRELMNHYLDQVNAPTQRIHELFDQITDHGRKRNISVDDGIRQAVERQKKEARARQGR